MKISVIIPCFNENNTIISILEKVNLERKNFDLEIIVSDDGSTDKTKVLLEENSNLYDKLILSEVNKGKGCAMRKGIEASTGDILLFQDADMEYDPKDYSKLIKPFIENNADVVYGTRFISSKPRRVIYFTHRLANFLITTMVNFFTNINFSDVETGYKLLRKEVLRSVKLNENSFGIEIEITMKIAKLNLKIFEVGISYNGRTYDEGKKIKFYHFFSVVYRIFLERIK